MGQIELPTTQRAYTLRLRGIDGDATWRGALWATHEAVNKGAKVFGDWLLTLRGGLCQTLADERIPKTKSKPERDPDDQERKNRRILLALSWLSVEDEHGAPKDAVVAKGSESSDCRSRKLCDALVRILKLRGVPNSDIGSADPAKRPEDQPNTWIGACLPSLSAAIREQSVWVDRSREFDAIRGEKKEKDAREDCKTLLYFLLKDDYLEMPKPGKSDDGAADKEPAPTDAAPAVEDDEGGGAVAKSSKGAATRTRHAFSHIFRQGKPFGKPKRSLQLVEHWWRYLKPLLDGSGIPFPPRGNVTLKGGDELQREMFSKAASRIAQLWTKQRQQAFDRKEREKADEELRKLEQNPANKESLSLLDELFKDRTPRTRQIVGWDRVVKKWESISIGDPEEAEDARIEAAKELQDAEPDKKFGDINLFMRLAPDKYRPAWAILPTYVAGTKARNDAKRLKVASFRHPDAHLSPVFCQFGESRPRIAFRRLKAFTNEPAGNDPRAVGMFLWHPDKKAARFTVLHAVSRRFDNEIGSACDTVQEGADQLPEVSRHGRLGAAAASLPSAATPARVSGVFDLKAVNNRNPNSDDEDDESEDDSAEDPETGKLKEPKWNGTLSTNRRDLAAIHSLMLKKDPREDARKKQLKWSLIVSAELDQRGPWYRYIDNAQNKAPFQRTVRKDEDKGERRKKGTKFIAWNGWPFQECSKPLKEKPPDKRKAGEKPSLIEDKSAARAYHASLILCRLPGLRILSVDLGLRYAAACAVWEALTHKSLEAEIDGRAVVAGGDSHDDLYLHTRHTDKDGKQRITTYRRTGPDMWARLDRNFLIKLQGEDKPTRAASQAELDYVSQLEGGLGRRPRADRDPPPRPVDELMSEAVQSVRIALRRHADRARIAFGLTSDHKPMPGDRKFWFHKAQDDDPKPSADAQAKANDRAAKHTEYLQDLLCLWYDLAASPKWRDDDAVNWWNEKILRLAEKSDFTPPPKLSEKDCADTDKRDRYEKKKARWKTIWDEQLKKKLAPPADDAEDLREGRERKADREAVRAMLAPVAEALRKDQQLRESLRELWAKRWFDDEGVRRRGLPNEDASDFAHERDQKGQRTGRTSAKEPGTGWHKRLRELTDRLVPRHLRMRRGETEAETKARALRRQSAMNVGGVSLTRIDALVELRRALVQFRTAGTPWGRVEIAPDRQPTTSPRVAGDDYARRLLDVIDHLREQRSKQLASRIAEAALGIGSEDRAKHWSINPKTGKRTRRPREQLWIDKDGGHGHRRFKACEAVVIERLDDYRPDEVRGRRENRMLAAWRKADFRKRLYEACQLHGLHLREVPANYTSRQCSRTGLPGFRCDDVPVEDFVRPHWSVRQAVKALTNNSDVGVEATFEKRLPVATEMAKKKLQDASAEGDSEHCFLVDLYSRWDSPQKTWTDAERIKWKLGEKAKWSLCPSQEDRLRKDKKYTAPSAVRVISRGGDLLAATDSETKRATQADLNAAANVGLRALLDPDWAGRWWYIPASLSDDGWRIPDPRRCAGAKCLEQWKVATDGAGYTKSGKPLAPGDDKKVKLAQEKFNVAKQAWDEAKKKLPKVSKSKGSSSGPDQSAKHPLQHEFEQAKRALAESKKAAAQKEVINLWHDPSPNELSGSWREHAAYWADVRYRVVKALRVFNGLSLK